MSGLIAPCDNVFLGRNYENRADSEETGIRTDALEAALNFAMEASSKSVSILDKGLDLPMNGYGISLPDLLGFAVVANLRSTKLSRKNPPHREKRDRDIKAWRRTMLLA